MIKSEFKKLNWKDFLKGLILAFISAFITSISQIINNRIQSGSFTLVKSDFIFTLIVASISTGSYLIKNLFTNSKDQFLKREPKNKILF